MEVSVGLFAVVGMRPGEEFCSYLPSLSGGFRRRTSSRITLRLVAMRDDTCWPYLGSVECRDVTLSPCVERPLSSREEDPTMASQR